MRRLASWFNDKFYAEVSGPLVTERVLKRHMTQRTGRRPARYRRAARGAPQYPLSSGLYRLAGAHARLAGRRAAELRRSRRRRSSVRGRLSGRSAVERRRSRQELVRAGEVAALVPSDSGRHAGRDCRRRKTTPISTSDRPDRIKAALIEQARARGFDASASRGPMRCRRPKRGSNASSPKARMATWRGWRRPPSAAPRRQRCGRKCARSIMLGMNYGPDEDPLAILARSDRAADLGLCQGRGLSRADQVAAQGRRALAHRQRRRRGEGVRRYRGGDGKAAGGKSRARLAGQAHQSGVATISAPGCFSARSSPRSTCRPTKPGGQSAAPAAPVSMSARPRHFPSPTGSMRGAAFPI